MEQMLKTGQIKNEDRELYENVLSGGKWPKDWEKDEQYIDEYDFQDGFSVELYIVKNPRQAEFRLSRYGFHMFTIESDSVIGDFHFENEQEFKKFTLLIAPEPQIYR